MNDLLKMIESIRKEGYSEPSAEARVCQDIVLKAIDSSSFNRNITVKGGIVMRSITGDARRATQDMDLDFIRYSLEEESIFRFIDRLNCLDGIKIQVEGSIEELSQQEYHGKRVYISITDENGYVLHSKIDLGVHKQIQIEQDEYCFDVCIDEDGASLLINSKEQIFTEKLRSLLRFGPFSTRYKDVFDLCWLSDHVDKERLMDYITIYIFADPDMKEIDMETILKRVQKTFANKNYLAHIEKSRSANWMNISPKDAMDKVTAFLETLQ